MTERREELTPFRLGHLQVAPARNLLTLDGVESAVEPRIMDVLCVLAAAQGDVVARSTLIERLWPVEYGADESLTRAISQLRRAYRELGGREAFIETIPKRGYRLLPTVESDGVAATTPATKLAPQQSPDTTTAASSPQSDAGGGSTLAQRTAANTTQAPEAVNQGVRYLGMSPSQFKALATAIVALSLIALYWFSRPPVEPPSDVAADALYGDTTSVAVLPLEALSNDASDAYLGRGIAEELLNALARFADLKVIARTSAFSMPDPHPDLSAVGQQLGAEHLVRGSIRRVGERMRITLQLLRTTDAASLWSKSYEFDAPQLFAIEDQIVRDLASALQVRLGVGAAAVRSDGTGIDPLAYEQYLQGLTLWGDRMRSDGNRASALDAFKRAAAFAPDFADAWASIGLVGVYSVGSPLSRDRETFMRDTETALQRALELDPDNITAHAGLAHFYATQRIDVPLALEHLSRATSLAPNAAQTQIATALVRRAFGDAEAAFAALDRVIALDPLNLVVQRVRAELLAELGRTDEAMEFFTPCLATQCLSEGFVVFGTFAAVLGDDQQVLSTWIDALDAFEARVANIPDERKPNVAKVMPAFFSIRLQRANADAERARIRALYDSNPITDTPGIWAPTFADVLDRQVLMHTLQLAYERGDLFSASYAFSPMYGTNPYPDWVLRDKRYHELWERPGMPALAAAWRSAGRTAGLPVSD